MKDHDDTSETDSSTVAGLSSGTALQILINDLESSLEKFPQKNKSSFTSFLELVAFDNPFSFWPNVVYSFFVAALALVVYCISADSWYLIEGLLFVIVIIFNCFFITIDAIFTRDEFACKISRLVSYLTTIDQSKLEYCNLKNIEFFPSSSVCRVVRDNNIVVIPSAVIVRGDVLALLPGERPPCSATYLPDFVAPTPPVKDFSAEKVDSGLKASDLLSDRTSTVPYPNVQYYKLNETPIVLKIEEELLPFRRRVPQPIRSLILAVQRWQFFVVAPVVIATSILLVVLAGSVYEYPTLERIVSDLLPFIIHSVMAISIPFLPTVLMVLRVHGNALIVDESQRLLSTRNDRADSGADEAFEHVETIKPTNLFTQSKLLVFRDLLMGRLPDSLPQNGNVLFGFANLNYLCAIDKEGILSSPKPVLQKLLLFSSAAQQQPSMTTMPRNVSFGTFMSSDTVSSAQGKHCRLETLHAITKFQDGSFSLDFDEKQWARHMGVLKAIGLNMVLTSSQLYSDRCRKFVNYLNSPFFRSIVDSPTSLTPPPASTNPSVTSAPVHLDVTNMHTFIPLTERIGFRTEQTLSKYKVEDFVGIFSATFPSPLRRAFATVCRDLTSPSIANSLQLFCQGHPDLILSMCSDFWDGSDLHPFTPSIRARVKDFCNRSSQTSYCVALSYAPLSQTLRAFSGDACLRFVPRNEAHVSSTTASPLLLASSAHNLMPRWADFVEESNQIFIGVAILQSQPLLPVIQLVQNLKTACSRFVFFSRESELMSRAFAEKIGLEANWNCFISLAESNQSNQTGNRDEEEKHHDTDESSRLLDRSSVAPIVVSSSCAPRLPSKDECSTEGTASPGGSPTLDSYNLTKRQRQTSTASAAPVMSIKTSSSAPNLSLLCVEEGLLQNGTLSPQGAGDGSNAEESSDDLSSHASTELIDVIENRAQLPRGIKEVRPHLAECDNVPLLVSLFTDCCQQSTDEMMSIFGENNGVVCSLGSSFVADNFSSFCRTDCAVSVLPLAPAVSTTNGQHGRNSQSNGESVAGSSTNFNNSNVPFSQQHQATVSAGLQQQARDIYSDIASRLVSLPCSLTIRNNRLCYLLQLMAQCRHYVACIKQVFFYAAFAYATIVLAHFAHLAVDRPVPLSPLQFLWQALFAIPLLSASLVTAPIDENILTQPPHRTRVTSATVAATLCYFLFTFLPGVPICLCLNILFDFFTWEKFRGQPLPLACSEDAADFQIISTTNESQATFVDSYQFSPPWWRLADMKPANGSSWLLPSGCEVDTAIFSQSFIVLSSELSSMFLGIYILLLSIGFVFPLASIWRRNPISQSRSFCTVLVATILGTIFIGLAHIFLAAYSPSFTDVHAASWVLAFVIPCVVALPTHELFKRRRIKKVHRQLKRIRLEFNTRLGLNSPF